MRSFSGNRQAPAIFNRVPNFSVERVCTLAKLLALSLHLTFALSSRMSLTHEGAVLFSGS